MSWARLDDAFHMNPKVRRAGNAAIGLYARCISYCACYHTDGFVDRKTAADFADKRAELAALTRHGFWESVEEGDVREVTDRRDTGNRPLPDVTVTMPEAGFFISDFLHYNKTKGEVEKHRRSGSKGGKAGAKAPAQAPALAPAQAFAEALPDPTQERSKTSDLEQVETFDGEFHALRVFRAVRPRFHSEQLRRALISFSRKLTPADFTAVVDSLEKNRRDIRDEAKYVMAALQTRVAERRAA